LVLDDFAADYPFSSKGKELLKNIGKEALTPQRVETAGQRMLDSMTGSRTTSTGARERAVDYVLARILLAAIGRPSATRKYAAAIAKQAVEKLVESPEAYLETLAKDFLPSIRPTEASNYSVSLADYLTSGNPLLYAPLEKGQLFFTRAELAELLYNAIKNRVGDLSSVSLKTLPPMVFEAAKQLEPRLPKEKLLSGFKSGKYLELPCIKAVHAGVAEGKRYYGSMALAIACVKDGVPKEDALKLASEYAENSVKGSSPYTAREAMQTIDWVYRNPSIGFSCTKIREQGLPTECGNCPLANERKRERNA